MERKILWWLINITFFVFLYLGLFESKEWALNVYKFILWVNVILTLIVYLSPDGRTKAKERGHSVSPAIKVIYDLVSAGALAAYGMFFYATLVILGLIMEIGMFAKDETESGGADA